MYLANSLSRIWMPCFDNDNAHRALLQRAIHIETAFISDGTRKLLMVVRQLIVIAFREL